jgi:DNA-binding MarR family transcriptional regulator
MELGKLFSELAFKMRLVRLAQENEAHTEDLTERDALILELLAERGRMTVSEIAQVCQNVSESTISTNITKLWRNRKFVSKTINPDNQRVTFVELTAKGRELMEKMADMRSRRMATFFEAMGISNEEQAVMERVFGRALDYLSSHAGPRSEYSTSGTRDDG